MVDGEKPSRALIDQSTFLKKRANDRIEESRERIGRAHRWLGLPVGRVCGTCGMSQAVGQFSDALPCSGERSTG